MKNSGCIFFCPTVCDGPENEHNMHMDDSEKLLYEEERIWKKQQRW